ncbi:hypothetical protein SY89_00778 [Halolamina pelagica]|uniref:DUF7573 domain-containing protein n=1 Tax=Halolamina pelagica TaxID=699431 RepID=A0A0P7HTV1_9EURY|nr:hypothetical protein [Halolamina pelagica]KPN30056.1 hypothetical protein SY89_00778 [Halolamina pelagica]
MSDDASLTDFAGEAAGDEAAGHGERAASGPGDGDPEANEPEADDPDAESAPETPTFTYTSTPDGAACAACGASVEQRWRAGEGGAAEAPDLAPDALVCSDCKEW